METLENTPLLNWQKKMLRVEDVALRTYHWLQSPNSPHNVFLPHAMMSHRAEYGKETRHVTRSRLHKLVEAAHTFPPQSGVAIVSGASRGLGKEITKRLLKNNWNVIAVARSPDSLQTLRNETGNLNMLLETMTGDVADNSRIRDIVREVFSRHGKIDLIVNNAQSAITTHLVGSCLDMTLDDIKKEFKLGFYGYYYLTKESLEYLKESKGTIINIESTSAFDLDPRTLPYSCAKIAQTVVSETLKDELLPYGIRVADIFPGGFNSDFYRDAKNIYGEALPPPKMSVVSVGEAVMQLLYGGNSTLTIADDSRRSVYSEMRSLLRYMCPAPVRNLVKRIKR